MFEFLKPQQQPVIDDVEATGTYADALLNVTSPELTRPRRANTGMKPIHAIIVKIATFPVALSVLRERSQNLPRQKRNGRTAPAFPSYDPQGGAT